MSAKRTGGGLGFVAFVFVAILYFGGHLDPLLYKAGLNYTACGQNVFGAVYCGQALTDYNTQAQGIQDHVQALQDQYQQGVRQLQSAVTQAQLQAEQAQICAQYPGAGC